MNEHSRRYLDRSTELPDDSFYIERHPDQQYYDPQQPDQHYTDQHYATQHYPEQYYADQNHPEQHYAEQHYPEQHYSGRRHFDQENDQEIHDRYDHSYADAPDYQAAVYHDSTYGNSAYTHTAYNVYTDPRPPVHYPGAEFLHDYNPDADTESESSYSDEVWLKEKHGRITYNDADLADINRGRRSGTAKKLGALAGIAGMLGLIGFLALSSLPDLTPGEIIAMEGYEGEQESNTPYNLASIREADLRDCATANCDDVTDTEANLVTTAPASTISTVDTSSQTTRVWQEVPSNTDAFTIADTTESAVESYTVIEEIPAVNSTTTTITTADSFATSSFTDSTYSDSGFSSTSSTDSGVTSYNEDLIVLQQWSNVRRSPDINGAIITSLAEGTNVRNLGQSGQWFEVELTGRRSVTGFMHRSTVALP